MAAAARAERLGNLNYLRKIADFIPTYSGSQAGLYDFIQACEWVYDQIEEDVMDAFLLLIKTKLKGDAESFISSRNIADWETLKNLLIGHYSDARDIEGLGRELTVSTQTGNETPRQFLVRIQTLLTKIRSSINLNPDNTAADKVTLIRSHETTALKTVLAGLRNPLGTTIRSQRPANLNEVASLLIDEENILYLQARNNNIDRKTRGAIPRDLYNLPQNSHRQVDIKTCNYCKKPGHVISECRRREFNNSNSNNQSRFSNSGSYPRFSNTYRPSNSQPPENPRTFNAHPPGGTANIPRNFPQGNNNANRPQNNQPNSNRPSIIQRNPNYPVNYLNESGEQYVDEHCTQPQESPDMNQVTQDFRNMSF